MDPSNSFGVNPDLPDGEQSELQRRLLSAHGTKFQERQLKNRPWNEKLSIMATVLQLVLSMTELLLASLWMHLFGIIIGVVAFVFSVVGGFVWYHRLLYSSDSKCVRYCVRPLFALTRFVGVCVLIALIVVHAIAPDPDWDDYPASCRQFPGMDNCTRVGQNATRNEDMFPPRLDFSLYWLRQTVNEWLDHRPQTTVLTSDVETDAQGDILSIFLHARILSFFWGFPDDLAIRAFCHRGRIVTATSTLNTCALCTIFCFPGWIYRARRAQYHDHHLDDPFGVKSSIVNLQQS